LTSGLSILVRRSCERRTTKLWRKKIEQARLIQLHSSGLKRRPALAAAICQARR
jgi:hypothetical protein